MILLLEALFMAFATFRNAWYFIEVKHAFNSKKEKEIRQKYLKIILIFLG